MLDVVFLVVVVAFFVLAAGVVRLCDRVVGVTDDAASPQPTPAREVRAA